MTQKVNKMPLVSVIIPTFNEQNTVKNCLASLKSQNYPRIEIIVVDDGSTDKTISIIKNCQLSTPRTELWAKAASCQLFRQNHLGPGPARNLGAKNARGNILIFVDADMTFDKNFIRDLTAPITNGKTIGTFSKNEMNANKDNIWSTCWNINRGWPPDRLIPPDYPDHAPVFRAILKKEFEKVDGFDATGEYTDDWSLSRKLAISSTLAPGAIYYHYNPASLIEVYRQARWIGKNEFISGDLRRRIRSLILYSFPASVIVGIFKSIINLNLRFLTFKILYDSAIFTSVIFSFFGEKKYK